MRSTTLVFGLSQLAVSVSAIHYQLIDSYTPANFFSKFSFFTGDDGTGGFADYLNEVDAGNAQLISTGANSVVFRADNTTNVATTSSGRPSVRLEGTTKYNKGIWVADIQHMPGDACGSWPAFWSYGDTWPQDGEIDIIEGVNLNTVNRATLHSGAGTCSLNNEAGSEFGSLVTPDCHTLDSAGDITNTAGCTISSGKSNTYGDGFNSVNGGYYVTQWTSSFIKIWFFARANKPATLDCDVPDVSALGEPDMFFSGCDFGTKFVNQHFVFTTNFCGAFAGATGVYDQSGCPSFGLATPNDNCVQYVASNPSAFTNQYWEVNSIKVYGETENAQSGVCHSSSSSSTRSSTHSSTHSSTRSSTLTSSHVTSSTSTKPTTSSFASVSGRNSSASFHFPSNGPSASGHGGHGGPGGASITFSGGAGPKPTNSKGSSGSYGSGSEGGYGSGSEGGYGSGSEGGSGSGGSLGWGAGPLPAGCSPVKVPFSTVLTTKLVDVCETGFTTKTVTTTVQFCPLCHEQPTSPYAGFTETVKICSTGCAASPIPVTLTVPWTSPATADPVWSYPASPAKPSAAAVAPVWSAGSTASAAAVWSASGSKASAVAGAVGGSASWPLNSTSTNTWSPAKVTTNSASTSFASVFVVIAAAAAAVMML